MFFFSACAQLLVGLVSAYRYEGPRVDKEVAKAEAEALGAAVKRAGNGKLVENDEVVRILTTRSKPHLVQTFMYYKEMHGRHVEEDLRQRGEETLLETVLCLVAPAKYFSQVIMGPTPAHPKNKKESFVSCDGMVVSLRVRDERDR